MSGDDSQTNIQDSGFYVTGGTLRYDAPSYVERAADRQILHGLQKGEFCYVLTSRQMGKSSLMVRTANRLQSAGVQAVVIDLTAIGLNVTPEQWYDGLALRVGRRLRMENEIDDFWTANARLSPVQRFFSTLREVVLLRHSGQVVLFVDEIDVVRSLPFPTTEFFGAIRECYNRRVEDPDLNRLTFCLLGAAAPADLIRDAHSTPFNVGVRVELTDFTPLEARALLRGLEQAWSAAGRRAGSGAPPTTELAQSVLERILHWTGGHPYLTQRLCRASLDLLVEGDSPFDGGAPQALPEPVALVDRLADELFLAPRAREQDDNLLYARERILRADADLASLLGLYERIHAGHAVRDDEANPLIEHLRMAGVVRLRAGLLEVRNRIYQRIFDGDWIRSNMPEAILCRENGDRISIKGTTSIGRGPSNSLVLTDEKVSRRHALVQAQGQHEFWLVDLGSSNGTFLNGRRVSQPVLLKDQDRIQLGPFLLMFRQAQAGVFAAGGAAKDDKTIHDLRAASCWMMVAVVGSTTQMFRAKGGGEPSTVTGSWLAESKTVVEESGGVIQKYLDDGFFAVWLNRDRAAVLRAIETFRQLQAQGDPAFSLVLHHASLFAPGGKPLTVESLDGRAAEQVFRLSDLANFLGESKLMSESAYEELKRDLKAESRGRHELRGFEGTHEVYGF